MKMNKFEGLFSSQVIGYNKQEVDSFVQKIAGEYDMLRCQFDDLLAKSSILRCQINELLINRQYK